MPLKEAPLPSSKVRQSAHIADSTSDHLLTPYLSRIFYLIDGPIGPDKP